MYKQLPSCSRANAIQPMIRQCSGNGTLDRNIHQMLQTCGCSRQWATRRIREFPRVLDCACVFLRSALTPLPHIRTPCQRGFDHFYGTLGGGGSYYQPPSLVLNNRVVAKDQLPKDYYYTDAINDEACNYIRSKSTRQDERPFFIYLSHVAPHWPLHAPQGVLMFRMSTAEWYHRLTLV